MDVKALEYDNLLTLIAPYHFEGRSQSAAFLRWFFEHIFRLDDTEADDAVCDAKDDKGIDGIVVSDINEKIYIFQAKIAQNSGKTLGDVALKEFVGSLHQFSDSKYVNALLESNANPRLKQLIMRHNLSSLIDDGYVVEGYFVTNQKIDNNAVEFLEKTPDLTVYDRTRISSEYVDLDVDGGVAKTSRINIFEDQLIIYKAGKQATLYQLITNASDLVALGGIEDQTLFSQNVRLALGNTKVNKDITKSVSTQDDHKRFPLFHNGITILANNIERADGYLKLTNYVVVNGAQSLSTLYNNRDHLTDELKIAVRAIELVQKPDLAKEITHKSNNQNSIKARDLKANNVIQQRLQKEMTDVFDTDYGYSIKRGDQDQNDISTVIGNEDAAALLLAMDLMRPWSCHQKYKFFDEFYSEIFSGPQVNAVRIVFLYELGQAVKSKLASIEYSPLANYKLTYYFILYCLSSIIRLDEDSLSIFRDPSGIFDNDNYDELIHAAASDLIIDIITDLNYEVKRLGDDFDFKSDLKSPKRVGLLGDEIIKDYHKQLEKGKAATFASAWRELVEG